MTDKDEAQIERGNEAWSAQCDRCTATMGYSKTESEAVIAWNNRPATVPKSVADGLPEALDGLIPLHDNPVHMTAMDRVNAWAAASAFARNRLAEYRKATQ